MFHWLSSLISKIRHFCGERDTIHEPRTTPQPPSHQTTTYTASPHQSRPNSSDVPSGHSIANLSLRDLSPRDLCPRYCFTLARFTLPPNLQYPSFPPTESTPPLNTQYALRIMQYYIPPITPKQPSYPSLPSATSSISCSSPYLKNRLCAQSRAFFRLFLRFLHYFLHQIANF